MGKIKTIEEIGEIIANKRKNDTGCKIVQCHGVFDLIHIGHIKHLEAAKKLGNILVVTITSDRYVNKGPGRPVFNQLLRAEAMAKNEDVDYVAINDFPTAIEAINIIKPNIFAKGSDYVDDSKSLTGNRVKEREAAENNGGKVVLTDEIAFSSSNILNKYFDLYPNEVYAYLENFRGKYSIEQITTILDSIRSKKILIIGDTIIDKYSYCKSLNKSPKENIIPARHLSDEIFAGGVLATANHLANFCDNVTLVTCLGNKGNEHLVGKINKKIDQKIFYRDDVPTVMKQRFVEVTYFAKLFEIQEMDDTIINNPISNDIRRFLIQKYDDYDLIIVNDFGHGCFDGSIIGTICGFPKFMAINVQTNSANLGFNLLTKYSRADYICVDEPEMRLACVDRTNDLVDLVKKIAVKMDCQNISVTHGKYETMTYNDKTGFYRTPVFSSKVVDTMGAGDAVFALTAPLVQMGVSMDIVGFVGNLVGALKVQIIGNRASVDKASLYRFMTALMK